MEETGALTTEEADETEEERDDLLELSETMDSGDDTDELEVAKGERRANGTLGGETLVCHLSVV